MYEECWTVALNTGLYAVSVLVDECESIALQALQPNDDLAVWAYNYGLER